MIQALPAPRLPAISTVGRGVPPTRGFALSLANGTGDGDVTDPPDVDPIVLYADGKARQDGDDDGTDLPNGNAPVDPRLVWLTMPIAPPVDTPPPVIAAATSAAAVSTLPIAAGLPGTTVPTLAPPTASPMATAGVAGPAVPPGATLPAADLAPPPPALPVAPLGDGLTVTPFVASTVPATPATIDAATPNGAVALADARATPSGPLPIAIPDPSRPATATPALQAFALAMHAGWKQDERQTKREATDPLATGGIATLAPMETVRHAVAAAGATQDGTLDTRREHWPAAMIDHIESLRDAADATSSRIRVVPDALGTIDLSVKRDGDTLHVHFAAEQAATRTLLADAQPRLAEIAEQRGLRLGDTNVGSGGSGQPQPRTPSPTIPDTPIPASARATIAAVADDDTRIA